MERSSRQDYVSVRIIGGLGNQLFQYAAGRALSLRLNCPLLLDIRSLVTQTPFRSYGLDAFKVAGKIESEQFEWHRYEQPNFHFDENFSNLQVGTKIFGFFQSELYFKDYKDVILQDLILEHEASRSFMHYASFIDSCRLSVAVHVRRGDYIKDKWTRDYFGLCEARYYEKAIKIAKSLHSGEVKFFIFSDDINMAKEMFLDMEGAVFVDSDENLPHEDLLLMSRCNFQILANSTFSWWSSYLNMKENKIVIAPRRWFAEETMRQLNTSDLHPDDTILI